jgi:hypothetical protein
MRTQPDQIPERIHSNIPEQIRDQVAALLADLPDFEHGAADLAATDIDAIARRLERAHEVLVHALESVEKD